MRQSLVVSGWAARSASSPSLSLAGPEQQAPVGPGRVGGASAPAFEFLPAGLEHPPPQDK